MKEKIIAYLILITIFAIFLTLMIYRLGWIKAIAIIFASVILTALIVYSLAILTK